MKRISTAAVAVAVSLLAACGTGGEGAPVSSPSPTATHADLTVTGAVALGSGAVIHGLPEEGQCRAHSQYSDIKGGLQVSILDATGTVVAVAELDEGKTTGADCVWWFTTTVPAGGRFYSAEVLDWESDKVAEADLATDVLQVLPAG